MVSYKEAKRTKQGLADHGSNTRRPANMKNKIVIVTGGSKGLGKTIAQMLVAKGNNVIICARSKSDIDCVAKEIGATAFVADITKSEDIKALTDFAVSTFGRIDVWINNAGIWTPRSVLEKADIDMWRKMFDINVFGTMMCSKSALIQMRAQETGILLNIISSSALTAKPTFCGYASSKWAVRGFTDSVREEYRDTPIKILSVYPSGIKTNLFDNDTSVDTSQYMSVESVAEKIIANLELENPLEELIIKRPQ